MKKTIIIIGYGYMGKKVAQLIQTTTGQAIYAISRHLPPDTPPINSILYDLDNDKAIFPLTKALEQAIILYLAPPPKTGQQDSRLTHFLTQLEEKKQFPQKIVLISTTGVYGNCHGAWVNEQQTLNPHVDRALRRADAEQQLTQFSKQHDISATILRVAGIYAQDKLPLKRLKSQTPIVRKEDSPYSNRIHADDLANICLQAMNEEHPGIFNCADGHPSTMFDYFTGLAKAFDLPQPPAISLEQAQQELSAGMLSYMHESRRIDSSKLLEDFQLKLQYPNFEDFLRQLKMQDNEA